METELIGFVDKKRRLEDGRESDGEDNVKGGVGDGENGDERSFLMSVEEEEEDIEKEEDDDEEEGEESKLGLDGGYGWVVVAGAFLAFVIAAGFLKSGGLFFLQFQERYNLGALSAAWPGSILSLLHYMSGPLTSATCNRYSVRTSVMIGSALVFVGLILNSLVDSFYFLFVCHSLLQGVGLSFIFLPGLFQVSSYFDKRRGLAVSLATAGGGVGTFTIIPLVNLLFQTYGYQGCFLILSAVLANGFVSAMTYKPLRKQQKYLRWLQKQTRQTSQSCHNLEEGDYSGIPLKETKSSVDIDEFTKTNTTALPQQYRITNSIKETNHDSKLEELSCRQNNHNDQENCYDCHQAPYEIKLVSRDENEIEFSGQTTTGSRKTMCCFTMKSALKICFPVENKRKNDDSNSNSTKSRRIFDFGLLKDFSFLLFLFGTVMFTMSLKAAYTFIPAVCVDKGLSKMDAALVLSIVGAVDTFCRIGLGFSLDSRALSPFRTQFFISFMFGVAVASVCIPFLSSFASFAAVSSVMGVCIGAHMSQMTVVLVDTRGKDVLPSCLGLIRLFQAFGVLTGPLLFGAIRDATGSYDVAFIMGAGLCVLGGVSLTVSHLVFCFQKKKRESIQDE